MTKALLKAEADPNIIAEAKGRCRTPLDVALDAGKDTILHRIGVVDNYGMRYNGQSFGWGKSSRQEWFKRNAW